MLTRIRREDYVHYEAEMFAYNQLDGFVPFAVVHKSDAHEIRFEAEGLVSFKRFMKGEGQLRFELLTHLLEGIARAYKVCEDYLLVFEHISFAFEDIYLMNDGFGFMYVPSCRGRDSNKALRALVDELVCMLDSTDQRIIEKVHQIQLAFKKEPFVTKGFVESIVSGCGA